MAVHRSGDERGPWTPSERLTPEQALARWAGVRAAVGAYVWQALYQQDPAPPEGAIFDIGAFRYWTSDPELAAQSGAVLIGEAELAAALARGFAEPSRRRS